MQDGAGDSTGDGTGESLPPPAPCPTPASSLIPSRGASILSSLLSRSVAVTLWRKRLTEVALRFRHLGMQEYSSGDLRARARAWGKGAGDRVRRQQAGAGGQCVQRAT